MTMPSRLLTRRATRAVLAWGLAIAWVVLIFSFSAQDGESSAELSSSVNDVVMDVLAVVASERIDEADPAEVHNVLRTAAHFMLYLFLGVWFATAQMYVLPAPMSYVNAALLGLIVGIVDEFYQYFVPGRHMAIEDIYTDFAGALTGVIMLWLFFLLREKTADSDEEAIDGDNTDSSTDA